MGASVVASAGDVLRFALLHLDGGLAADGTRLLSAQSVASMQERQIELVDDTVLGEAWGLGWILDHFGDIAVIGHDGNSLGQNAFMRIAPEQRFGFCLQTNVESALSMYRELAAWMFGERLGVTPREDPEPLGSRGIAATTRSCSSCRSATAICSPCSSTPTTKAVARRTCISAAEPTDESTEPRHFFRTPQTIMTFAANDGGQPRSTGRVPVLRRS